MPCTSLPAENFHLYDANPPLPIGDQAAVRNWPPTFFLHFGAMLANVVSDDLRSSFGFLYSCTMLPYLCPIATGDTAAICTLSADYATRSNRAWKKRRYFGS